MRKTLLPRCLEKDIYTQALKEFRFVLHSYLPLKHFSQFHDNPLKICDIAEREKRKVLEGFEQVISDPGLVKQLQLELQKVFSEFVTTNAVHKSRTKSFFKKQIDFTCENLKTSLEIQLLQNPDMEIESLQEFLEWGKMMAINYFEECFSKLGNAVFYEEQKYKLQIQLNNLKTEMIEKQRCHLKNEEESAALVRDVKSDILEMSRRLQFQKGRLSKQDSMRKVHELYCYLVGKGDLFTEKYRTSFEQLSGTLEGAIKYLIEAEEDQDEDDVSWWAERLDEQFKAYCFGEDHRLEIARRGRCYESTDGNDGEIEEILEEESASETMAIGAVPMPVGLNLQDSDEMDGEDEDDVMLDLRGKEGTGTSHQQEEEGHGSGSTSKQQQIGEIENQATPERTADIMTSILSTGVYISKAMGTSAARILSENQVFEVDSESNQLGPEMTMTRSDRGDDIHVDPGINRRSHTQREAECESSVEGFSTSKSKRRKLDENQNQSYELIDLDEGSILEHEHASATESSKPIGIDMEDANANAPLLLRAIREGQSVELIKKLLEEGKNVNVRTNDEFKDNATHLVIESLIEGTRTYEEALQILNLLMANGFNLINDGDSRGITPILYAMEYSELDQKLLKWFHANGADFNAVEPESGRSVLFQAIKHRKGAGMICKILRFGADPMHVSKCEANAIHWSAFYANCMALRIFMKKVKVNARDIDQRTPLHLLFSQNECPIDYELCLKMLLRNGADFGARSVEGYVPLVEWIKYGEGNVFHTLIRTKEELPITKEIASAALTAIVEEMKQLKKFLPEEEGTRNVAMNAFLQFFVFLISENEATLQLKDETGWKLENWERLEELILKPDFVKMINYIGDKNWNDELVHIRTEILGCLNFYTRSLSNSRSVCIPVEVVLVCLLKCRNYIGFVKVCYLLKKFCDLR